jgi:ethanolamine utilization protein EutA
METLLSVGIDIGTTTTQLVFSHLTVENQGNAFSVPRMVITRREIIYRSAIHFTPLRSTDLIDGSGVREIVAQEYAAAGVERESVDTGAVIITGETARKENARTVVEELAEFAGDFVVSTAGPDLESILAARGAGAPEASEQRQGLLLHMDIGGGTSNLAVFDRGTLVSTGCLDIGGRVVKLENGTISWLSPKIQTLFPELHVGQRAERERLQPVADCLAESLACAAGLRSMTPAAKTLVTHRLPKWQGNLAYVSFSGGVADLIWHRQEDWDRYGDLGVLLGQAIVHSPLFREVEPIQLGETIRATVIGAGSQTTELSGSTVFHRQVTFPLQNLPVLRLEQVTAQRLVEGAGWMGDQQGQVQFALSIPGWCSPSFSQVQQLAQELAKGYRALAGVFPVVILEQDMAKALGQALALELPGALLCLDGIHADSGDYLDVGQPIAGGLALPVIVKTLAFPNGGGEA